MTRAQLVELGLGEAAIRHRLERGRLHRLMPGVYAVGRREIGERGRWMAAVLAAGPQALLSHRSAAALLGIRKQRPGSMIEVVVPARVTRRRPGIRIYQRAPSVSDRFVPEGEGPGTLAVPTGRGDAAAAAAAGRVAVIPAPLRWRRVDGIPVTGPAVVLVDLASCLPTWELEAAINEADHLDRVDPEQLRSVIDLLPRRPGRRRLRDLLDSAGQALTTTALEHRFLPLAAEAGLPLPTTQATPGSHRVDFYWPELGLVVEADSLRYHRTAFKQATDKRRDNKHALSGLLTLHFTHGQICHEPTYVRTELKQAVRRLGGKLRQ